MKRDGWKGFFRWAVISVAVMLAFFALMLQEAKAPVEPEYTAEGETQPPAASVSEVGEKIAQGCEILQTMGFSRCGHSVTRRITAPDSVVGMDFAAAQGYYALWQVEDFSKDKITMSREIPLHCPMHEVLNVNDAGEIVLSRNVYGDGMAVTKDYHRLLQEFDEDTQAQLLLGMGFDSAEAAEDWLAAH